MGGKENCRFRGNDGLRVIGRPVSRTACCYWLVPVLLPPFIVPLVDPFDIEPPTPVLVLALPLAALVPVLWLLEPSLVPGLVVTPMPLLLFIVPLVEPFDIELLSPVEPDCTVCATARPQAASESAKAALRILRVMFWFP